MKKGYYLPLLLTISAISMIVISAVLTMTFTQLKVVKKQAKSTSALNIAEAGVNYYLWRLSHNPTDYCNGQTCSGSGPFGPYTIDYKDASGNSVGSYEITITPPGQNDTYVTVSSTGLTATGEKRTVKSTLGVPSYAQYAFVTNAEAWFGNGESADGPVHSNKGIRFDGTNSSIVSSAAATYTPSNCFGGDGTVKAGVWGSGGPSSYWQYPVPQVDFNQLTADLNTLQTEAQNDGVFLPTLLNNRGQKTHTGYAIEVRNDGTLRIGKVTGRRDSGGSSGCAAHEYNVTSRIQSIAWEAGYISYPANGVIYVADNLWVWGQANSPLSIVSGRLPDTASTNTRIFLQNDLTYTVKDGSVAVGLISQGDILVNSDSEADLEINAFLLSQKGKVFRPYYANNVKTKITVYGGIAANSWWTWSWSSGSSTVSGYQTTVQTYDTNLAITPPPFFPKTGSYSVLTWREDVSP